ncbi:MAG: hypothetical protein QM762_19795 [Chryseolinea sp.]
MQLAIFSGEFAVAENGAVWITSESMGDRALPFICEHIALIIQRSNIMFPRCDMPMIGSEHHPRISGHL